MKKPKIIRIKTNGDCPFCGRAMEVHGNTEECAGCDAGQCHYTKIV